MDPLTIALLALRSAGTLFGLQGRTDIAGAINAGLDAIQAGKNVDAYMQEIADALEAEVPIDWDDLRARINSEVDDFLGDTGDDDETET